MATTYTLTPCGFDAFDARVKPFAGRQVKKVQPFGCPKNGTMGHCYVETLEGDFVWAGAGKLAYERNEMSNWVIICYDDVHTDEDGKSAFLFWNNNMGWVGFDSATLFFDEDVLRANLPYGGAWLPLDRVIA